MPSYLEGLFGRVVEAGRGVVETGQEIWQKLTAPGDPYFKPSGEPYTRADLPQPTALITDTAKAITDIVVRHKPQPERSKPKSWETPKAYEARANLEHLIAGIDKQGPMLIVDGRTTVSTMTLDIVLHEVNNYAKKKLLSPEQAEHYRRYAIQEQAARYATT